MKSLKDYAKKYKRKYKCNRCNYTSDDEKILKRHKAVMHGDFGAGDKIKSSDYKRETKEPNDNDKIVEGYLQAIGGEVPIVYRWSKSGGYRMYTKSTKYGDNIEIIYDNNTSKFVLKNYDKLLSDYKAAHEEEFEAQ